MFHCLLSEKNKYLNIQRKNESSFIYKVYKLELEMLEGDSNQPVGILSWAGEVKIKNYMNLALHICGIAKILLDSK